MISVFDAQDLIRQHVVPLAPMRCPLAELPGRVLREPIAAGEDLPPFDRSAMDGYAVREDEIADVLDVVGEIRAGDSINRDLKPGEAMRIFTGGRLPGAGLKVVMQEHTEADGTRMRIVRRVTDTFIRRRGEDARAGEQLLEPGLGLDASAVALLASLGRTTARVSPLPRILHLTTGDEVVSADAAPAEGQIRNSNAPLIAGLCREAGAGAVTHVHARDDWPHLLEILAQAQAGTFDVILVSGGSGPGNYDFTAKLFDHLGATIRCRQVNVRPGKPLIFGTIARAPAPQIVFGLPGNPLSHLVCFHLFVRRALDHLLDRAAAPIVTAALAENMHDTGNARETWWPVRVSARAGRLEARALGWKSSGDITRLPQANALMKVPAATPSLAAGNGVDILPIRGLCF